MKRIKSFGYVIKEKLVHYYRNYNSDNKEKNMKLIARQKIKGITDDFGLRALDGIKYFESDVENPEELIKLFEKEYPEFGKCDYEIVD